MAEEVKKEGVNLMNYCPTFANTIDAHRITELAYEKLAPNAGRALHDRLITAYYSEAMDIMNHDILLSEAVKVGLDEESVRKMFADTTGRRQFADSVKRKQAMSNINGVPHFVINGFACFVFQWILLSSRYSFFCFSLHTNPTSFLTSHKANMYWVVLLSRVSWYVPSNVLYPSK